MLVFGIALLVSFVVMAIAWNPLALPKPSSLHGVEIDRLWDVSMGLIVVTFFIVQPILFWFAYKYRGKEGQKASYVEHNNKLEFVIEEYYKLLLLLSTQSLELFPSFPKL